MNLKTMVVDDQPEILEVMQAMLEYLEAEVLVLSDSREAAERVKAQKFDAIFLDVNMPHMDGFELIKSIRSSPLNGKVPIVVLTGSDEAQTLRRSFKAGADYFLGKPVYLEHIESLYGALVSTMLTNRRKHARLPFRTTVLCSIGAKGDVQFVAKSLDIGEGGKAFECPVSLEVGQPLNLQFSLPSATEPLRLTAKVVRVTPPSRFGTEFIQPSTTDLEAIQAFVIGEIQQ